MLLLFLTVLAFLIQFLYLDEFTFHPFVLEADTDIVDGHDGMLAVRTPDIEIQKKFRPVLLPLPGQFRVEPCNL